ncbi:MAG: hypothetical protein U1E77_18860 [Inhella sp.]
MGPRGNRLLGMDEIDACAELGGFFNLRAAASWRLTQSLLGGTGACSGGLRWGPTWWLPPLRTTSTAWMVSAGLSWANARPRSATSRRDRSSNRRAAAATRSTAPVAACRTRTRNCAGTGCCSPTGC